ncbi:hypothetical protein QNM97_22175 [Gordonia sp. L191]|uniref:hypothetical protein n=1 Tax=Gordonia sp. L191 TaxID=2982699 RepID=UPI0024BF4587|nr:hypothetical protein [Gordonia sp. L191]WHU46653.1 hypothetical protein QNM97_22175 [Gordonia sp. L191]
MSVQPCSDEAAAQWILDQDREWYDLTARGPLGYEQTARLRFIPDPAYVGQRENDAVIPDHIASGPTELWQIAVATSLLRSHTATPEDCYFLIWEGWPYPEYKSTAAAQVDLRGGVFDSETIVRSYYLFRGSSDLFAWTEPSESGAHQPPLEKLLPLPSFIWPSDRAWCITKDVDPHFASIGANTRAVDELLSDTRIDVVVDDPTSEPPRYT